MDKQRALVIEADSFLAKLYTVKLQDLGYEVDTVGNGQDGALMLKKNHYDGLLMDVALPYRDGYMILKDIKRMKKTIRGIIIATELQQKDDKDKALSLGAHHYFIKNDSQVYEIIDTFHKLVRKKRTQNAKTTKKTVKKTTTNTTKKSSTKKK